MSPPKPHIHFLHVGKTGGTAIKAALKPFEHLVQLHDHSVRLSDIPVGDRVFFFLRDPVSRFVSAFNSRLRCGRPRYDFPWSPDEAKAFKRFKSPEELALALSSSNLLKRRSAVAAMRAIKHLSNSYWDWLHDGETMNHRTAHILFIGQPAHLATDFEALCSRLGIRQAVLPVDEVAMHKTSARLDTSLRSKSVETLKAWYANDYDA